MPRVTHLQTNFTAGEISPRLYGRVDVARYQNGAKKVRDALPQIYGGVARRPGSLFVREAKDSSKAVRLIPFVRNSSSAYMIEMGDGYMRFYKDGAVVMSGGSPYEIVSPYTEAQLFEVDYTQGADTMFMFHAAVAPLRLVCAGDTSWTLSAAAFLNTPFEETGTYPAATLTPSAAGPAGAVITLVASAGVFAVTDIGSSLKINGGIVKINTYADNQNVGGVVKRELSGVAAAPPDAWSIHTPAWSASRGYPCTGTLYEQRLIAAGSPSFPQTIWGSMTGAYLDFQQGTADDDGFAFTIGSDAVNPIRYVASGRALLALTIGGEFTVQGGQEKPLAPTNAQIKQRTNYGVAQVRPVRIRDSELFVQRAGRKVRQLGYSVSTDDWSGPDLSVLAEHLTESGIVDMSWQQEPDSIVWLARADGALVSITLDKDQEVTAWAMHEEFGRPDASGNRTVFVESVACIPEEDGDQVWLLVRRTIGGATKRYLERLSATTRLDCSIVSSGAVATVWSGLGHLEGETAGAVAGDYYAGEFEVSGGQVTLDKATAQVNVGLGYTSRLTLLDPEIQTGMGSAAGNAMRTSEVTVRFHETTGCEVNGKAISFRSTGEDALAAPQVFSGVKRLENLGWERGRDELEFTQDEPMPWHILSVTRKFTVNDG